MTVTASGILISVNFVHPSNAYAPILVTLSGISICVILEFWNAYDAIVSVPSGILTVSSDVHPENNDPL